MAENNLYSVHVHNDDALRELEKIMLKFGISYELTCGTHEYSFIVKEDGLGASPIHGEIQRACEHLAKRGVGGLFGTFFHFTTNADSIDKLKR